MKEKPTVLSAVGLGDRNIKIGEEFERLLRITAWMRECLESEMASGFGTAGKSGVDDRTLKKWEALVKAFDTLAYAKARVDKHAKDSTKAMTPERELEVVRQYIRAMDHAARGRFLEGEQEWHGLNEPSR